MWPPLSISGDPEKGRFVVATRSVAQGDLMFADVSYAAFPSVRVRNYVPTLVDISLSPSSVAYHATQLIVRQCWDDLVMGCGGVISRVPGAELDRIDALAVVTICLLRGTAEGHEAFRNNIGIEAGVVWSSGEWEDGNDKLVGYGRRLAQDRVRGDPGHFTTTPAAASHALRPGTKCTFGP